MIDYTLEYLAFNGVNDVFIYCGAHSEAIETYIEESSRWRPGSPISPFQNLEFIRVSDATSVGDFLRDLDKRSLISGDFVLVHGDLVSNIPLDPIITKHRARREVNRDACMTVVLRSVGEEPHRAAKARGITPVFHIDAKNSRILQYEETHPLQHDRNVLTDIALFKHSSVEQRADLIDCGIDICTPDVLALWSESFDYELPRKNFLHGVLKDWELNGKLMYSEIIEEGYGARASNLQMYDCISKDILGRWTFPFVPTSNLMHDQTYRRKGNSDLENNVLVNGGSQVIRSAIGSSTTVESGSTITKSVIGRRCKIGKNVKIENSYIFNGTVIGDGTTVIHSIIAGSVVIGENCHIPEGSLISYNVQIDNGIQLPTKPTVRLAIKDDNGDDVDNDVSLVGPGGKGADYQVLVDEDESEDEDEESDRDPSIILNSLVYSREGFNLSTESLSTLASDSEYDSDEDEEHGGYLHPGDGARERLSSFTSDDAGKPDAFHSDAVNGLVDALRSDDNDDFDGAKLEFMGLRLANNASDSSMRRAIAIAFVKRASELLNPEHGALEPTKAAEKALTDKKGALKFIREVGVGGEDVKQQSEFALAVQKGLVGIKGLETGRAGTLLAAMLQQLYNLDVLEEDGILAWWVDKRADEGESMTKIKEKCRVLVEWLENADEEGSSEEEDSDEENDEADE